MAHVHCTMYNRDFLPMRHQQTTHRYILLLLFAFWIILKPLINVILHKRLSNFYVAKIVASYWVYAMDSFFPWLYNKYVLFSSSFINDYRRSIYPIFRHWKLMTAQFQGENWRMNHIVPVFVSVDVTRNIFYLYFPIFRLWDLLNKKKNFCVPQILEPAP